MLISVLVMVEQEKVIRLFITTEDVSKEKGDYHYIVNGIDNLFNVIDRLTFNGSDLIYVHLDSSVSLEEINSKLIKLCKLFKDEGLVSTADFNRMGLPVEGGKYYTSIDKNNRFTSERYMITFIK